VLPSFLAVIAILIRSVLKALYCVRRVPSLRAVRQGRLLQNLMQGLVVFQIV
jgi:hypothetical protein